MDDGGPHPGDLLSPPGGLLDSVRLSENMFLELVKPDRASLDELLVVGLFVKPYIGNRLGQSRIRSRAGERSTCLPSERPCSCRRDR